MENLPIARYRFDFEVQTTIRLPEYAGSMLRGAFGRALRHVACMTKEKNCRECPLYKTCPYTRIFETPPPEKHELQKFSQIPNPYVIEPPQWGERIYSPGETLTFNMVLIGKSLEHLALIIYAWQRAFSREVGHGTAVMRRATHLGAQETTIYEEGDKYISEHNPELKLKSDGKKEYVLQILTPLRLQENGKPISPERMTSRDLLVSLIRRASLLLDFHCGQKKETDFKKLSEMAAKVPFTHKLRWKDWTRFSSRQQQKMQLGGVVGEWRITEVPEEFSFFLELGQWTHVGKNATFGLGKYELT